MFSYHRLIISLLLFSLVGTILAQVSPPTLIGGEKPVGILRYDLSNGILVLAQPRFSLSYARASVCLPLPESFRSHSAALSSWLEHLYLDSAEENRETPRQIMATLDCQVSVETDGDYVFFNLLCLSEDLPRAITTFLDILKEDRSREPFWGQALARLRLAHREPEVFGWDNAAPAITAALLSGRRLADIIGPAPATPLEPDALAALLTRMLLPDGLRILLSGRCEGEEISRQIAEKTAQWKKVEAMPALTGGRPGAPAAFEFVEWSTLATTPPRIIFYIKGPRPDSAELAPFLMSCSLLADGMTSLVGRRLMSRQKRIPFWLDTRFHTNARRSVFVLEVHVPPEHFDETEVQVLTAMELIQRGRWLEVDLDRARNQAFVHAAGWGQSLTAFHSRILHTRQPVQKSYLEEWQQLFSAVKRQQLQTAARKYLTLDRCAVLELPGKLEKPRGFDAASFRDTMNALLPISVRTALEEMKDVPDVPLPLPEREPSPLWGADFVPKVVRSGILRGPRVMLSETHDVPLVWMEVLYPGGRLIETEDTAGVNRLALLQRLLACRDPQGRLLLEKLEALGGRVRIFADNEYSGISLLAPNYFRQAVTGQFFTILHRHRPEKEDLARAETWRDLWSRPGEDSPAQRVLTATNAVFYGLGNAFGRPAGAGDKLDGETIAYHYSRHFYRMLPHVAILGDIQGTELLPVMSEFVSGSIFTQADLPLLRPIFPPGKVFEDIEPGMYVADLALPGPYAGDKDLVRMEILRWLYLNQPEIRGAFPAAWIDVVPLLSRGAIHLRFLADETGLTNTVPQVLKYLKDLAGQPINSWSLATSIKRAQLDYAVRKTDPWTHCHWLALNSLWNSPFWQDSAYNEILTSIRKDQIRDMLLRYFDGASYSLTYERLADPAPPPVEEEMAPGDAKGQDTPDREAVRPSNTGHVAVTS
ncbi:MAG: insulinase family protein [Acidobacteria bacterium]|nr:insulinase family protein [Acidobacteriota bacterium]